MIQHGAASAQVRRASPIVNAAALARGTCTTPPALVVASLRSALGPFHRRPSNLGEKGAGEGGVGLLSPSLERPAARAEAGGPVVLVVVKRNISRGGNRMRLEECQRCGRKIRRPDNYIKIRLCGEAIFMHWPCFRDLLGCPRPTTVLKGSKANEDARH